MSVTHFRHDSLAAFTVVEMLVVITVIALLAAIAVISYGGWRNHTAEANVKSDLVGLKSAMEKQRGWNNSYPVLTAGAVFNGSGDTSFFTSSDDVILEYYAGNSEEYCINGTSIYNSSIQFYIDTRASSLEVQEGECTGTIAAEGEEESGGGGGGPSTPPAYNPPIDGTSWDLEDIQFICSSSANAPSGYTVINAGSTGTVSGGSGHDIIYRPVANGTTDGSGGNDILCIGTGTGVINASAGEDIVYVEAGSGAVDLSGGGDVVISLGTHTGTMSGSAGNDVFIVRSTGNGSIDGGAGSDTIRSESTFTGSASSIENYL